MVQLIRETISKGNTESLTEKRDTTESETKDFQRPELARNDETQDKVVDNPSVSPDKQITETNDHPVDSNEKPGIDSNSKKLDAQEKIEPHDKKNDTHTDELRKDEKPSSSDKPTTERKLSKKLTGKDD